MSSKQRIFVLFGLLAALSVCIVLTESVTQKAATRPTEPDAAPSAGESTFNDGGRKFV